MTDNSIDVPRRKLDEIRFIYEQHPEQKDVYVEGPFDAAIMRWVLGQMEHRSVAVYEVSAIDLPKEEVLAIRPRANNRERLVLLSDVIRNSDAIFSLCVVDSDFSLHTMDLVGTEALFLTDYPCMEGYLVAPSILEKFIHLGCNRPQWSVERILASLLRVSRELFYFRFADEVLDWKMPWPKKNTCLKMQDWKIDFDADEFRTKWLSSNAKLNEMEKFDLTVERLKNDYVGAVDMELNGHDFFTLLGWGLQKSGLGREKTHPDIVRQAFLMAIDNGETVDSCLFSSIDEHLSRANSE